MAMYSHSKLSTFEQCPYKYKLRYIDKIKPEIEKSIEAHLGTAVHDSLEWLYNSVQNEKLPTLDEVIEYYSKKWQDTWTDKIEIAKKEFTEKDYFNKGIQFLVDYYMKHCPFQDGTIECEKKIILTLDKNSEKKIIGFIDRLVHNENDGTLEIHDYKTANSIPPKEKIETDRQLALYSIAIKEIYGQDKEVKLVWHYLAHNQKITSRRTNDQLENLKKEIINLIDKIESTTNFPTKESVLCNWCEYKTICPRFNENIPETIQTQIKEFPTASKYIRR